MRKIKTFSVISLFIFLFYNCENNPDETTVNLPELTTINVSNISGTSAQCGGVIISDGGTSLNACGVCWSTDQSPTILDPKTINDIEGNSFISKINDLNPGTTYYVRAYATNTFGTGYGNTISFTTLNIPLIATNDVSEITSTSAECGGNILYDGGENIIARGVCWSTLKNPTISDSKTSDGIGSGSFSSNIIGLTSGTTYYVCAYATNIYGTGYGNIISFTTLSVSTVTDIDGNTYKTIKIGNQWWMAENLRVTHYNDGVAIPNVKKSSDWRNINYEAYCIYNNDTSIASTYGLLYDGYEIYRVAPIGWHIPSDSEWTILTDYLGGESVAGSKLKEIGTDHWIYPNTGANNESGFSALPGGLRSTNGSFDKMGLYAYFWSSTEYDDSKIIVWCRKLYYDDSEISRDHFYRYYGFSIRCVND